MQQKGKTLLEMIAVLSIIGILPVVTLSGLQWALAKHKANETMRDVTLWTFTALDSEQLYNISAGPLFFNELGSTSSQGYPMSLYIQDNDVFIVRVESIPPKVCKRLLDIIDDIPVTVNDIRFTGEDICLQSENKFDFYLDKHQNDIQNTCIPRCSEDETCCNRTCRTIETPCGTDECTDCGSNFCIQNTLCCPNATDLVCNSTTCCDKNKGLTCTSEGCVCMNGRTYNPDTDTCDCPDGSFPFNEDELCCKAGYTPLNGECRQVVCSGGTSGNTNWACKLDGIACGTNCDSTGHNCGRGICWPTDCPTGFPFALMDNGWFWGGGERYGCRMEGTNCYTISGTSSACWYDPNNHTCCGADMNGECTDNGICDPRVCEQFKDGDATSTYYHRGRDTGCRFDNFHPDGDAVYCQRSSATQWNCYLNGTAIYGGRLCGTCSTPPCSDCLETNMCQLINSDMYQDENGYCCKDFEKGTLCRPKVYLDYAFLIEDGTYKRCGASVNWNTGRTHVGDCFPIDCLDGYAWEQVGTGDVYGCRNQTTNIFYYREGNAYTYFISSSVCGKECLEDRSSCSLYYMEECAPLDTETGKRHCITGKEVTETCVCSTDKSLLPGELCCAEGQSNINGVCAVL